MNKFATATIALALALPLSACGDPTILGSTIARAKVCPAAGKYCTQTYGNRPTVGITKEARYLNTLADGSPNYWRFLGRRYTTDASPVVQFCGGSSAINPFERYATNRGVTVVNPGVAQNTFDFTRKVTTKTSFAAEVDVDKVLNASGIPTGSPRVAAEAALKAALNRLDKRDLAMRGTYRFVELDPSTVALLLDDPGETEFAACRSELQDPDNAVITSLTMVEIDTLTASGELQSDASASLDATLKDILTSAQLASLKANFSQEVNEVYKVVFGKTYQVLSIGGWGFKNA